jgi:hypothetical protein
MMLSFLLDEHLSPDIARQMAQKHTAVFIVSLNDWRAGKLMHQPDEVLLTAAAEDSLTLVTYDMKTILPLLMQWGMAGTSHSGVVFADHRTVAPNDFGSLIRALVSLWETSANDDWTNRVEYLRTAP